MHRHAEAEDTGAAVSQVTWAVAAVLTSDLLRVASAELASKVLADII
jgi:hypothetical protein